MDSDLFFNLINDEKKVNQHLYTAGAYWKHKNKRTIYQIKKKGISKFRGIDSGVGTSYTDSILYDIRNEYNVKGRIVSSFLSLPYLKSVFDGQLKITKSLIEKSINYQQMIFSNSNRVKELVNKYNFNDTTEFGCVQKFNLNKNFYSTHYLEMANRVENFSKFLNFNNFKSYFEIGGGFGSNIHFLLQNFKNIRKVIYIDIVPNIYVGTLYLKNFFNNHVIDYTQTKKMEKIKFTDDESLEIICIPPWEIAKLDCKVDHFHNSASFVEMPEDVVLNYINYIKKLNTQSVSLLSYSKYNPKNTINPKSLGDFFDKKLDYHEMPYIIPGLKPSFHYFVGKLN